MGNGNSDSEIDIILHTKESTTKKVLKIYCQKDNPLLTSHHDAIMSQFVVPPESRCETPSYLLLAPRVSNQRVKIHWTPVGTDSYKEVVHPSLSNLRANWLHGGSNASMSVLLQATNSLLELCAQKANPFTRLCSSPRPKVKRKPNYLVRSERSLRRTHRMLRKLFPGSQKY